jgi:DNA-binding transcriptional LysR family regulator
MSDVDLQLLTTFVRVYEARNVTRAADDLGLSQPTVSHALARLRRQVGDELFVRAPGGVRPTDHADALYRDAAPALATLRGAVEHARGFDPATARRLFRICLTDLGETAILPAVLTEITGRAPNVEIEVVPMNVDRAASWLQTGEIDLAVATMDLGPSVRTELLFADVYVLAMRRGHPLAEKALTVADFEAARHAVVTDVAGHRMPVEAMAALGIERRIALRVPNFAAIPPALARTDLVAVVPWGAVRMRPVHGDLVSRPLPFEVRPVDVRLWRRPGTESPAVRWLRSTIVEASARPDDWAYPHPATT